MEATLFATLAHLALKTRLRDLTAVALGPSARAEKQSHTSRWILAFFTARARQVGRVKMAREKKFLCPLLRTESI